MSRLRPVLTALNLSIVFILYVFIFSIINSLTPPLNGNVLCQRCADKNEVFLLHKMKTIF